jgi:hypothetical protein
MPVGRVTACDKSWVLIQSDGGIFYRASRRDCYSNCKVGDPVEFDIGQDPGTQHAIAVDVSVPRP